MQQHFHRIAILGAGRLGRCLALALVARGESVVAVASRTPAHARARAAELPGAQALGMSEATAAADLVLLTVPDDHIAPLAASLPWRAGQAAVHCSGATSLDALAAARAAGAKVGGLHPLQIFSGPVANPEAALTLLAGSHAAIEAEDATLQARLQQLALGLGMQPFALPPGARAAYHAAAGYAASFLLSMLDEAGAIWRDAGLPPEAALPALLPLARGTLAAAEARGLAGALSGPISRGDAGVVAAHLQALGGQGRADFYRLIAQRQLGLARASGRLDAAALARLEELLGDVDGGLVPDA